MIAATDVRRYLPELTGDGEDPKLLEMIAAVDAQGARWTGRDATFGSDTYTRTISSDGGPALWLPERPITEVTSVTDAFTDEVIAATADGGALYRDDNGDWLKGRRRYTVVWTAGWATLPDDLAETLARWAAHLYRQRGQLGRSSIAQQGASTAFRTEAIPAFARQVLASYVVGAYGG